MPSCAVKSCGISAYQAKKVGISLHACPKNPDVRKRWRSFCRVADLPAEFRVCSQHFNAEDFEHRFQTDARRILTLEAVPSIFTPPPANPSARTVRAKNKARSELVAELLRQHATDASTEESAPPADHVQSTGNSLWSYSATFLRVSQFMQESIREVHVSGNTDQIPSNNPSKAGGAVIVEQVRNTLKHDLSPGDNGRVLMFCDAQGEEVCLVGVDGGSSGKAFQARTEPWTDNSLTTNGKMIGDELDRQNETGRLKTIRDLRSIVDRQKLTIRNLQAQLHEKQIQINDLNRLMQGIIKDKDRQISNLASDLEHARKLNCDVLKTAEERVNENVRAGLKKVFTPNQTDLVLGLKKKVTWTPKEIEMAFSLRYHSQPAYQIVRTDMNIPLPCLRSLREWASRIQMRKGVLTDVFTMLEIAGKQMSPLERVTVLAFDEMSVEKTVEIDKRNDDIVGPHGEMQVVFARGLFSKWKQPIYVDFDQKMTKAILDDLITRLHSVGFTVVANVHDCGGGNMGLWRELGINYAEGRTSMKHPVIGQDIYFLPDPPHLLKLIRNWLLDDGFFYKGKLVTKKFLVELVEKASSLKKPFSSQGSEVKNIELISMFKLTMRHILVTGSERQNVRLAAELLSHTTAVNLIRHFGEFEEARLLAEIIEKVNSWFDIMNSYRLYNVVPSKRCYGTDLQYQNGILDDMTEFISNMRTLKDQKLPHATHLQIFQKAILTSINSFKNLFIMLQKQYEMEYIMAYKLNQDLLENLFAMIRQNGGYDDHPSPLQALNRLRLIILGKTLTHQLKRNQNTCAAPFEEKFIMSCLFENKKELSSKPGTTEELTPSDEEDDMWTYKPDQRPLEESDGVEYAMGYIARSVLKTNPEMGSYTYKINDPLEDGCHKENYVEDLSNGGLVRPSEDWMETANQMESFFNHMHNTGADSSVIGFKQRTNVKSRTIRKLKAKFPHVPDNVLKSYATRRINIRVKRMKKQIEELKIKKKHNITRKRKMKSNDQIFDQSEQRSAVVRKNQKKLKHFRN